MALFVAGAQGGLGGTVSTGCGLVRPIDDASVAAAAIVRSFRYTTLHASGCTIPVGCSQHTMDPICGTGAHECAEDECGAGGLQVPFNSRSYLLADAVAAEECEEQPLGGNFLCVDFKAGAYELAGKTLSLTLDLSNADCGCNAAVYLVGMPDSRKAGDCGDRYCDANAVCGLSCVEIDLVEANKVAFVSTVHVADDTSGEAFGLGHYVKQERRFTSASHCSYGPRSACTIDTNKPFDASFTFSAGPHPWSYL